MPVALLPTEREALMREIAARKGLFGQVVDPDAALRDAQEADFLAELHDKQRDGAMSTSKRVIFQCGRRAGKTMALIFIFIRYARKYPNATLPYITLTRDQARRNFWRPLKQVNDRFRLGVEFNEQRLVARFPNGAEIQLAGAKDSDAIEVFRGDKFPLVAIDEAGSFNPHIEELVLDVFDAALGDYDGTMIMCGNPSRVPSGYYYDACKGFRPGWDVHKWNILDNSRFPRWAGKADWKERAQKYLAKKADELGGWDSPRFIIEQLGEWYLDPDAQYYKFKPGRNTFAEMPRKNWIYGLGVDVGYEDPTAFVIMAVSPYCKEMYVVETFAKKKMLDDDVVAKVREYEKRYELTKKICDFSQKQFVVSLNTKHALGLVAAVKSDKLQSVDVLNSDFLTGKVKVAEGETEFQKELTTVMWNEDRDGPAPTRQHGHHADRHDALLYVWRAMLPFSGKLVGDPADAREEAALVNPGRPLDPIEAEAQARVDSARREEDYGF